MSFKMGKEKESAPCLFPFGYFFEITENLIFRE